MAALLERDRELAAIERHLDALRDGAGGVLVAEGAAGVGKSALLAELRRAARAGDARVLSAIGGEIEREFAFGMVRQLLEAELLGSDAERRTRLLSGAAEIAGSVLGATPQAQATGEDASFATLHALYWLVAALAEEQPLVLVLDDAHWADAPSLRFVDFLARRVAELPVLVALGMRPGEPGAETALLSGIAGVQSAEVLRPRALSRDGVEAIVAARSGVDAAVTDAAHETTGGNPLLLRELVRSLEDSDAPLTADAVRATVPSSVRRSVELRVARLGDDARTAAEGLATLGDRTDPALLSRVTGLPRDALDDALSTLRDAGLVGGEPARFVHPLLREAVADGVAANVRNRHSAAAARVLRDRPGAEEQLVVQLLAGPPLGEAWAADALRDAGYRALAEGAPDLAVRRLRRAAEERDGESDAAASLALGQALVRSGDVTGIASLAVASEADDPLVAGRALRHLIGVQYQLDNSVDPERLRRIEAAIARLQPDGPPDVVDELYALIVAVTTGDWDFPEERARMLAMRGDGVPPAVRHLRALDAVGQDTPAAEIVALVLGAARDAPVTLIGQVEGSSLPLGIAALCAVDARDEADALLSEAETTAARSGSRLGRAFNQTVRAEWALMCSSIAVAEASGRDAIELSRELGIEKNAQAAASMLGAALVHRGRLDEAEDLLEGIRDDEAPWGKAILLSDRALLRLARGRAADAAADMREVQAIAERYAMRRFPRAFTRPRLATALAAAGEREEAHAIAAEEVDVARRTGRVGLEVAALTALARAASDEREALGALEAAVARGEDARSPLTVAIARYELGAALRRAGKRVDAREHLRVAQESAARIEATALEARALEELVVAGAKPRSRFSSGVEALTPSERRVAEHAARGMSNREIAETLFVTRKTVELHLGNAYGKLGIRSRTQLGDALGGAYAD